MTKKQVAIGLFGVIWILVALLGFHLYQSISAQGVPAYPNPSQFRWYILFPCFFILENGTLFLFSSKIRPWGFFLAAITQLVALVVFFAVGAGGI
jgi:4-amino-4-deoxy-L-arabinose transferase-like glycosyltransferase